MASIFVSLMKTLVHSLQPVVKATDEMLLVAGACTAVSFTNAENSLNSLRDSGPIHNIHLQSRIYRVVLLHCVTISKVMVAFR